MVGWIQVKLKGDKLLIPTLGAELAGYPKPIKQSSS
jgi:hypothetical protein